MRAYYDSSKNMICVSELYSDICEINSPANDFLTKIRPLLKTLVSNNEELELKIIEYMCMFNIIFPIEFKRIFETQHDTVVLEISNFGIDLDISKTFINETYNVAKSQILEYQSKNKNRLVDSDPRTNKMKPKQK
jgi:hypothetical protein